MNGEGQRIERRRYEVEERPVLGNYHENEYVAYKVYYDDGSVYNSVEHHDSQMPRDGVQLIMLYLKHWIRGGPRYRLIIQGDDEYRLPDWGETKYGRWMSDEEYRILCERALSDWVAPGEAEEGEA